MQRTYVRSLEELKLWTYNNNNNNQFIFLSDEIQKEKIQQNII